MTKTMEMPFGRTAPDNLRTPIFITGPTGIVVSYKPEESFNFQHAKFTLAMLHGIAESNRNNALMKESSMRINAREMTAISKELKQIKHDEFVERQGRKRLRTQCDELRTLAEQLRVASISKSLADHMAETEKAKKALVEAKLNQKQQAEEQRQQMLAQIQEEELREHQVRAEYGAVLVDQMQDKLDQRKQKCGKILAEREERLALQKLINEEDKLHKQEMRQQKVRSRNEIFEFMNEQKAHRDMIKMQEKEEEANLLEVQRKLSEGKQRIDEERREEQRRHEEISLRIGNQVLAIENQKRERDSLLLDLLQKEYRAKNEERYRQQLEQEQMDRLRVKQELDNYRTYMSEIKKEKKRLNREAIAKRYEESSVTQEALNQEQERLMHKRRKEHGATLLSMIEENQRKRAADLAETVQFFEMKTKAEAERQLIIEDERLKMLSEVSPSVLRYLPKNVLSKEDKQLFDLAKHQQQLGGGDA